MSYNKEKTGEHHPDLHTDSRTETESQTCTVQRDAATSYLGLFVSDWNSYFQGDSGSLAKITLQFASENHTVVCAQGGRGILQDQ